MWNWSRDSSNHGGKKESYNKIALALLGRDDGRFLILCFNLVKSLTRIIKICLASLGVGGKYPKTVGSWCGGHYTKTCVKQELVICCFRESVSG